MAVRHIKVVQTLIVNGDQLLPSPGKRNLLLEIKLDEEPGVSLPWPDVVVEALVIVDVFRVDQTEPSCQLSSRYKAYTWAGAK